VRTFRYSPPQNDCVAPRSNRKPSGERENVRFCYGRQNSAKGAPVTTRKRTTTRKPATRNLRAVKAPPPPAPPETPSATEPPSDLSDAAKAWWRAEAGEYELEAHHLRLLSEAARAWDRCQQARAIIDAEGIVVRDRFGQAKPHPATAIERDARAAYMRAMRELDLDGAPEPDPRPARLGRSR
jgi:phage terminase small subunit